MRLIDADALWEKAVPHYFDNFGYAVPIEDIEAAPTIEQPTWISVDERLPTESGRYLSICKFPLWHRDSPMYYLIEFFSTEFGAWFCDGVKRHGVLYWMPLPQPPKGVE